MPTYVIFDPYYNGAVVNIEIGNYDKALGYLDIALKLISNNKFKARINTACLINLGSTYVKRALTAGNKEDYDRAFDYFNQPCQQPPRLETNHSRSPS